MNFEIINHRPIFFFNVGRIRSNKIRSRLGGQGNEGNLRTKGSTVMNRSRPAWRMAERTASWLAVKLRLTGTFPAKITARLAINPPLPGGSTIPTRGLSVCWRMYLESTIAVARTLSKPSDESSVPSSIFAVFPYCLSPRINMLPRFLLKNPRWVKASSCACRISS